MTRVSRLAPYREADSSLDWKGVVSAAYFDRVSLMAEGWFAPPKGAECAPILLLDIHY
jgi:hypothetical protein